MHKFTDFYKNQVTLSFADHPFSKEPKHVLIICRYQNEWLLTRHKERGLEFPGGKVEAYENAEEGAVREVKEETGAIVEKLDYIGQYYVDGKREHVIKNVYFADIRELIDQPSYFETMGPVLISHLPHDMKINERYSFIMKDNVVRLAINHVKQFYKKDINHHANV